MKGISIRRAYIVHELHREQEREKEREREREREKERERERERERYPRRAICPSRSRARLALDPAATATHQRGGQGSIVGTVT